MRFKRREIDREALLREIRDMAVAGTLEARSARVMLEALGQSRWNARSLDETERGYVEEITAKYALTRPERDIPAGWLRGMSKEAQYNLKSLMGEYIARNITPENAEDSEPVLSEEFVSYIFLILFQNGYFRDAFNANPRHTQDQVALWFLRVAGFGRLEEEVLSYMAWKMRTQARNNRILKKTKTHDFFCDCAGEWRSIFDYAMGLRFETICKGLGTDPTAEPSKILKEVIKEIRAGHVGKCSPENVIKPLLKYLETANLRTFTLPPGERAARARARIERARDELQRYLDSIGVKYK